MTPPKLTPDETPQALELFSDGYEQQGSDFLLESYAIDDSGKTVNHKSITYLLFHS